MVARSPADASGEAWRRMDNRRADGRPCSSGLRHDRELPRRLRIRSFSENRCQARVPPSGYRFVSFSAPYKVFGVLCLVAVLTWWNVLCATFRLALGGDAYTHIFIVLPVSAVLIAFRLRDSAGHARPS